MQRDTKKSTYKKMKVMSFALASGLLLAACSADDGTNEDPVSNDEPTETPAEPTEEVEDNEESQATDESEEDQPTDEADNQGPESDNIEGAVTLFEGHYIVGEEIPAGRYKMTSQGSGNIMIENNDDRNTSIAEVLEDGSMNMGVTSITDDLTDGTEIELIGIEETIFEPVTERSASNVLSTGTWEVGVDIEPGSYEVTVPDERSGRISVFAGVNDLPLVDSPIDPDGELGPEAMSVDLEEGQQVVVAASEELIFEQQ